MDWHKERDEEEKDGALAEMSGDPEEEEDEVEIGEEEEEN